MNRDTSTLTNHLPPTHALPRTAMSDSVAPGFCGWFGDARSDDGTAVLRAMAQRLTPMSVEPQFESLAHRLGVATVGIAAGSRLLTQDGLAAVICGTPYWQTTTLQDIATRDGHGRALEIAWRNDGPDLLRKLGGTFSVLIADAATQTVLLATDRMGILPLYYAVHENTSLAFGTSATSIQAHPHFRASVEPQAILHYLYFHVVPGPLGIYRGQRKLLPGEYLLFRPGAVRTSFYWDPAFTDNGGDNLDVLANEFRQRMRNAVARCAPDERSGTFLSGGIDSSTVTGYVTQVTGQPTRSYSIGFDASGYDEMEYARTAAKHFGVDHHIYYVTPQDVVSIVPRVAETFDEPFGNSSVVPSYYCARLAQADGVRTLLAGDGGDELFGGNTRYAKQKLFDIYWRLPQTLRRHLVEPVLRNLPGRDVFPPLRKLCSYVEQAREPMPDRLESYNFLRRTPIFEVLHADLLAAASPEAPRDLQRETYTRARSASIVNRMLFLDWKHTLADNDLRKVGRMCELAGVAVRYPFLDDEMIDFSLRVPARLKVNGFKLRYLVKYALRDFLPRAVLEKSKHGFGLPFGVWMRSHAPLCDLAYDSLSDLKHRHFVNAAYIDRLIALHRDDHAAYYGEFVWVLMMLELWLRAHQTSIS